MTDLYNFFYFSIPGHTLIQSNNAKNHFKMNNSGVYTSIDMVTQTVLQQLLVRHHTTISTSFHSNHSMFSSNIQMCAYLHRINELHIVRLFGCSATEELHRNFRFRYFVFRSSHPSIQPNIQIECLSVLTDYQTNMCYIVYTRNKRNIRNGKYTRIRTYCDIVGCGQGLGHPSCTHYPPRLNKDAFGLLRKLSKLLLC